MRRSNRQTKDTKTQAGGNKPPPPKLTALALFDDDDEQWEDGIGFSHTSTIEIIEEE